jgi:hypothetical protein
VYEATDFAVIEDLVEVVGQGANTNYSISGAHQYHGPGAACSIR